MELSSLIIVYSYHHHNTEKVATVMAKVLDAEVKYPKYVDLKEVQSHDLIGFGSGIYGADFHSSIHDLVKSMPEMKGKRSFLFSTNGAPGFAQNDELIKMQLRTNHEKIRKILGSKGFVVMDDFTCPGLNTNAFMKFFGGLNKGHPDKDDLRQAELFARKLKLKVEK
jgi:flavodoxin